MPILDGKEQERQGLMEIAKLMVVSARTAPKTSWMIRVRNQRRMLQSLKTSNILNKHDFRELYQKVKGGYFRSRRHLTLYLTEHGLLKQEGTKPDQAKQEKPVPKKENKPSTE